MKISNIILIICVIYLVLLIYNTYNPELFSVSPRKISETTYCDVDIIDENYTKLCSKNIFCFVLFKNSNSENIENKYSYNYNTNNLSWYEKYLKTQLHQFYRLLQDKNWKNYCILHFIDKITLNYIIPELNISVKQYILSYANKFPKFRYALLSYHSEKFINPKTGYHYDYFGSLARFICLKMPCFDVVIFRDAHTTMPSKYTTYDKEWRDAWLNKTNYKFWLYNMPNYNPFHTMGEHALLAGAWAVRKIQGEKYLFSDDMWNSTFGQLNNIDKNDFFSKSEYGIDERILLLLAQNKDFIDNSYITGMTWSFWLFFSQHNPRTLSRYDNDTKNKYILQKKDFNKVNWHKNKNNIPILQMDYPLMDQFQPYYRESTCVIKYIDDILNSKQYTTVNDLWRTIEQLKTSECNDDFCELTKKLLRMVPARNNLWEFIFDSGDKSDNIYKLNLRDYLKSNEWFNSLKIDMDNICDVNQKYFTGGKFIYDVYERKLDNNHNDLPENQVLPTNYPL